MPGVAGGLRQGRGGGGIAGGLHHGVHLGVQLFQGGGVAEALVEQELAEVRDGIARGVLLELARGPVHALVVGERVRVGADDVAVHQGGAASGAGIADGAAHGGVAGQQIAAVALLDRKSPESF